MPQSLCDLIHATQMPDEHLLNPQKQSWMVFILEPVKQTWKGFIKKLRPSHQSSSVPVIFQTKKTGGIFFIFFFFCHALQDFKKSHLEAVTAEAVTSLSAIVAVKKQ